MLSQGMSRRSDADRAEAIVGEKQSLMQLLRQSLQLSLVVPLLAISCPSPLQSQVATNGPPVSGRHKPRSLTASEADEVRSQGLNPTGMMIEADLPITRLLTEKELGGLAGRGIDPEYYRGKPVEVATDEEVAALQRLINNAQQTNTIAAAADLTKAYIWMDNFMGMTNASLVAHVKDMKAESLKFRLEGKDYHYSGHYTVMLDKPRPHKKPRFGFGSPETAKLVVLEGVGGETFTLSDATIWETRKGFINAVALDKEWIHSGGYTIQK